MIWLVELSMPNGTDADLGHAKIITWLSAPGGPRCLVDADTEPDAVQLAGRRVVSIRLAPDDLYVDTATRTVWEVFGGGTSARLLGYVPP